MAIGESTWRFDVLNTPLRDAATRFTARDVARAPHAKPV